MRVGKGLQLGVSFKPLGRNPLPYGCGLESTDVDSVFIITTGRNPLPYGCGLESCERSPDRDPGPSRNPLPYGCGLEREKVLFCDDPARVVILCRMDAGWKEMPHGATM